MPESTPNLNALDLILSPITNFFSPRFPTVIMVGDSNTDSSGATAASCPPAPVSPTPTNFTEIAVQDQSTKERLSAEDLAAMIEAINMQLRELAGYWKTALYQAVLHPRGEALTAGYTLIFKDTTDIAGANGYHSKDSENVAQGFVFVETILQSAANGILKRKIMAGTSVANVLSHELIEMVGNPYIDRLHIIDFRRVGGLRYIQPSGAPLSPAQVNTLPPVLSGLTPEELVDSVQNNYVILRARNKDVEVSDFILPSWFGDSVTGPFNFKQTLPAPRTLDIGGYINLSMRVGNLIITRNE
jgi:hypothetical protein